MKEKYHWLRKTFNSHQTSFAPPSLLPSNQVVAGMNWRQEAPADFRANVKPPAEYKIHSKENDGCIKTLAWSPCMEAFTAEIPRKGGANIFKNMLL
ncbi:hypothetical protein PoB_003592700 [Plakobranchus ocellatus]|uniref:Uncharacterized protein n=1 Tax=Plakobranchus ocellatus TaxID=259542 RepID=A0AAV4AR58_9GAST|nr:hypothetical protein PoB_003592700 [Plakobranchus ocellatus]